MDGKSDFILRQLAKAYITNPQQLPDRTILILINNLKKMINQGPKKEIYLTNLLKMEVISDEEKDGYLEKESTDVGIERIKFNNLHKSNLPIYKISLLRTICDFISGMTDQFAISQFEDLYESKRK